MLARTVDGSLSDPGTASIDINDYRSPRLKRKGLACFCGLEDRGGGNLDQLGPKFLRIIPDKLS